MFESYWEVKDRTLLLLLNRNLFPLLLPLISICFCCCCSSSQFVPLLHLSLAILGDLCSSCQAESFRLGSGFELRSERGRVLPPLYFVLILALSRYWLIVSNALSRYWLIVFKYWLIVFILWSVQLTLVDLEIRTFIDLGSGSGYWLIVFDVDGPESTIWRTHSRGIVLFGRKRDGSAITILS